MNKKTKKAIVKYFDKKYQAIKIKVMNDEGIDELYDFEDEDNWSEDDLMRKVDYIFHKKFGFEFFDL